MICPWLFFFSFLFSACKNRIQVSGFRISLLKLDIGFHVLQSKLSTQKLDTGHWTLNGQYWTLDICSNFLSIQLKVQIQVQSESTAQITTNTNTKHNQSRVNPLNTQHSTSLDCTGLDWTGLQTEDWRQETGESRIKNQEKNPKTWLWFSLMLV